jgi:Phospholipase A2
MKERACALIVLATLVISGAASAQTNAPSDRALALPEADPPAIEPRTDREPPAPTRPEDAPVIPSFQRRSAQQAGGNANELNTGDERAREKLPGGSVSETLSARDLYHGNYCGHGNRGQGAAPTDELDAACKRHDECYEAARHRSCACNVVLAREALVLANTARLSRELRGRAASVVQAAQLMECEKP